MWLLFVSFVIGKILFFFFLWDGYNKSLIQKQRTIGFKSIHVLLSGFFGISREFSRIEIVFAWFSRTSRHFVVPDSRVGTRSCFHLIFQSHLAYLQWHLYASVRHFHTNEGRRHGWNLIHVKRTSYVGSDCIRDIPGICGSYVIEEW